MDYDFCEYIDSLNLTDEQIVKKYGQCVADEYMIWVYYNRK